MQNAIQNSGWIELNKISLHSDNISVGLRYLTQATRIAMPTAGCTNALATNLLYNPDK